VKKTEAQLSAWLKDLAPSDELRRWFDHNPERWEEFQRRYVKELEDSQQTPLLEDLLAKAHRETVTLVFAARDQKRNNAAVLKSFLEKRLDAESR
jgi:uncharacterized protein YeaO (DUF488 family)